MKTPKKLTKKDKIKIHKELHNKLDELLNCYVESILLLPNPKNKKDLNKIMLLDFVEWSYQQTINPNCFKQNYHKNNQ